MGSEDRKYLGERLRLLRIQKGLTLRDLASSVGKTAGYLSKIERGKVNPSLSTLKQIADVLGSPLMYLLESEFTAAATLIRKGEHRRLIVSPYLEYEILSAPNHQIALFRVRLKRGGSSGKRPYSHRGIETGIVLKGRVRIVVGREKFILKAGDSITYSCEIPHRFENIGSQEAVGIWAVSPPTF